MKIRDGKMKEFEDFIDDLYLESHHVEADIINFINQLKEAGKKIEKHYFQLDVACSEEPIFRERVYCYELYHRLRCELAGGCKPDDSYPYKLDGEVDKAGHPIVHPNLGSVKPDLLYTSLVQTPKT